MSSVSCSQISSSWKWLGAIEWNLSEPYRCEKISTDSQGGVSSSCMTPWNRSSVHYLIKTVRSLHNSCDTKIVCSLQINWIILCNVLSRGPGCTAALGTSTHCQHCQLMKAFQAFYLHFRKERSTTASST